MDRTITAQAIARVSFRRAAEFVRKPSSGLFGDHVDSDAPSRRCFRTSMTAEAPGGMTVGHDVDVEILAIRSEEDRVDIDLAWAPTGGGSTLPSFTGTLHASRGDGLTTQLELEGSYRVPLGPLGRFGDGVMGNRVARRSVTDLLDRMATRIEARALDASTRAQVTPTPRPPDMRRESRSDTTTS